MTIGNFITYTGIWLYPPFALLTWVIMQSIAEDWGISMTVVYLCTAIIPLIFPITMTATNRDRQCRGQTDFSLKATLGLSEKDEKHSKAYIDAAYPKAPLNYSSPVPTGLIVGKQGKKYIYCPIEKDGINAFCVGTPGSGKSVLLLSWIYSMMYRQEIADAAKVKVSGRQWNTFLVDIKGELFEKLLQIKSAEYHAEDYPEFHVVQPSNRNSYGWDVFYRVHKKGVTETEIIKAVSDIADALVVATGDNPYFSDNAKKVLSGILYFAVKSDWEFVPTIQKLMQTNFGELLTQIVADAEERHMGIVVSKLKNFTDKEGNESIQDIESTLKSYLEVFSYPDIEYCMYHNPNKTSPAALNDGITNMDLAIEEAMLEAYRPIFRLVTMQVLRHAESEFKEDDDRYTCLILDEAARVAGSQNDGLDSAMATLRNRHTALICLYQSISQFKDIYPEQKAMTLLNLCELKIFLSGSGDKDTADYVSGMAGEYESTSMSYKKKGAFGGKSDGSYSQNRRPIVENSDLLKLREKGEVIAFIYGHYVRCKKMRYFEDSLLKPILEKHKKERQKEGRKPEKSGD